MSNRFPKVTDRRITVHRPSGRPDIDLEFEAVVGFDSEGTPYVAFAWLDESALANPNCMAEDIIDEFKELAYKRQIQDAVDADQEAHDGDF